VAAYRDRPDGCGRRVHRRAARPRETFSPRPLTTSNAWAVTVSPLRANVDAAPIGELEALADLVVAA
jgi:hypothetical protein